MRIIGDRQKGKNDGNGRPDKSGGDRSEKKREKPENETPAKTPRRNGGIDLSI